MRRRCTGLWQYAATFCVTFLLTALLLKGGGRQTQPHLSHRGTILSSVMGEGGTDDNTTGSGQSALTQERGCGPNDPHQVILLTYGRSGSSLTHDIISIHPDVFTYYEPLHNLAKSFGGKQSEHLRKTGRYLHLTDIGEYNTAAARMVEKLMICDYSRLNRFATLNAHASKFPSTQRLYYCVHDAMTSRQEHACLKDGENRCLRKPIKFLKIIRMAVRTIAPMLEHYPCLKLIYLVRDARGSYLSKEKMFKSHGGNVTYDAERFCSRYKKDVNDIIRLKNQFPGRVLMTRFETIAKFPVISAKKIYDYIGLTFSKKYAMFVFNKTHSSHPGGGYNTNRANSEDACYKWRETIPYNYVREFDRFCSEPFFKLGYLPAQSEQEVRNLEHPLIFHKEHFS